MRGARRRTTRRNLRGGGGCNDRGHGDDMTFNMCLRQAFYIKRKAGNTKLVGVSPTVSWNKHGGVAAAWQIVVEVTGWDARKG